MPEDIYLKAEKILNTPMNQFITPRVELVELLRQIYNRICWLEDLDRLPDNKISKIRKSNGSSSPGQGPE